MWEDMNKRFFRIFMESRHLAGWITLILFTFIGIIAVTFGAGTVNVVLSVLLGLIAVFLIYWIIKIIVLFFQTK
jgi:ammonia channel protein AmtB